MTSATEEDNVEFFFFLFILKVMTVHLKPIPSKISNKKLTIRVDEFFNLLFYIYINIHYRCVLNEC